MSLLLLILLVLLVFGGLSPATGWHEYGWAPSGGSLVLLLLYLLFFR